MHSVSDGTNKALKLCVVLCILLTFLFIGGRTLTVGAEETNGVLRSRAFKFYHITSRQAQEMLSQLKLGSGYDQLTENVLIVTSSKGSDLVEATEVITILDQPVPVGIWVLLVGSDLQPLPNIDMLSTRMRTITVGSMKDAPSKGARNPAILDIIDNKLIAIAAEEILLDIQKAVEAWQQENPAVAPAAPMTDAVEPAADAPTATEEAVDRDPAAAETPELVPLVPSSAEEKTSLEEVMTGLLELEDAKADAAEKADPSEMLEAEPDSTEDYLSDELLKALLDEEKKHQPKPEPDTLKPVAETKAVPLPDIPEMGEEISLQDAIKMLLQDDKPAAATPPTPVQPEPLATTHADEPDRPQSVSENLRLQRELAILRQQLAEAQTQQTAPEDTIELEIPKDEESETRIITQRPRALTQFEEAIGEEQLETIIDLPQEVELEQLVDLVGKQLGLNYMYDPTILRNQKVFLKINEGRIKVRDLYGLMESVLRLRGFVMTRRDNLVTIIKSADANQVAAQVDTSIRLPGDPIQPGDIIVSTLFRLKHVPAAAAQKTLADMKLGMANGFQQIAETNTLIVTDYAYRMPRIEEVLEMVDVAGEEKIFKFRALKYMQAGELVSKLTDLVSKMEDVSMEVADGQPSAAGAEPVRYTTQRVRNPQTGQIETRRVPLPNQPQQAGAAAAAVAAQETVFIDTDERTNRLLMIGTQRQVNLIEQLIDTLDVRQAGLKFVKEYVIQNVEASEVVNVLNELGLAAISVSSSASTTPAQTSAAQRAAAARAQQQGQPTPAPAAATSPAVSRGGGGGDQPSISIRPATNSLLVNGTEEQHEAIELVIAHVDVVQKDQRTIREYEIQYVDTQEIIDTMMDLGIISSQRAGTTTAQRGTTTATGRTTARTAQPQAVAGEGGAPVAQGLSGLAGAEGSSEDITAHEPQISVLEATNSLLVYATPRQHKAISLLIAHADRVPETTTTPYVVYALENQSPVELAEVLTKLIQETVEEVGKTTTPESRIQTAGVVSGDGGVPSREEQKIRIIPDEMSYSLIVYANKRNQQWISELIAELDEYRPQVLLDCTLVEITKDESFKYDMDIISKTYNGLTLNSPSPISTISGDFSANRYAEGRSSSGNLTGFFNSDMVQALLDTVQTKGYGRIMARPKVLVNDNQEGEIRTENTTSIAQQKTYINPATGTSPESKSVDVSFAPFSAGVTLRIRPHISKGDMLRLEISLNRTDFTERQDVTVAGQTYPRPPDLLSTDVTTVSTVPDGTTIILGGLETINQSKKQSKVPLLGDVPLIGGLFRGVDDIGKQGKLYIFVKANILRPGDQIGGLEDIRRVSGKDRAAFEEMERKFQEEQDWPGIKPKPMDPVKVLDEDEDWRYLIEKD